MTTSMTLTQVDNDYPYVHNEIIKTLKEANLDPYILDIKMTGTSGGTTAAEIDPPDNVFDGETTPAKLWVVSSSTSDTDAAISHCRLVKIIGIAEVAKYSPFNKSLGNKRIVTEEIVALDGTTDVETTNLWVRVFHMSGIKFGSGGQDAAGDITLSDDASGTTVYLTISTGNTESNGAALFVPLNQKMVSVNESAAMTSMTNAPTTNVILTKDYEVSVLGRTDDDLSKDIGVASAYNTVIPTMSPKSYGNKIIFKHHHVTGANTWAWNVPMLIWLDEEVK